MTCAKDGAQVFDRGARVSRSAAGRDGRLSRERSCDTRKGNQRPHGRVSRGADVRTLCSGKSSGNAGASEVLPVSGGERSSTRRGPGCETALKSWIYEEQVNQSQAT